MALTAIEITALIISLLALIKIIVILIRPRSWLGVVHLIYAKPNVTMISALVLALIVLSYLLQELTIVQVFASMLFLALLTIFSVAIYYTEIKTLADKLYKDKNLLRKSWLPILVWLILIFWTFFEIFSTN
ncbi:MAG: hypothetical protein AB1571_04050 [Nanoarchaeota archaeon]